MLKTIVSIPVEDIRSSEYNPATRIHNVKKLVDSIQENGQLHPITVVRFEDGTYRVADGHRRLEAVKALEKASILAVVHDPSKNETEEECLNRLFVELNKPTKAFNGRDRLNVALQGGPCFDPTIKSAKLQLETLFPEPEMREMLVRQEVTTTALNLAKRSAKYVLRGVGENTPTYMRRVRIHLGYILRNDVQQPLTVYLRLGYDPEALKKAIDNNRPPPRVSSDRLIDGWQK